MAVLGDLAELLVKHEEFLKGDASRKYLDPDDQRNAFLEWLGNSQQPGASPRALRVDALLRARAGASSR